MKVLLLHPPVSNLNAPYLSVPALSAFLKEKGVDVTSVDLNILTFDRLLCADLIAESGHFCERRYRELESKKRLSMTEAREYARIAPFVVRGPYLAERIEDIKACIRGRKQKWAFGKFASFDELIRQALELIFLPFYETERVAFEFLQIPQYAPQPKNTVFSSDKAVCWALNAKSRFDNVLSELLAPYREGGFDLVGISVSFSHQLLLALKAANIFHAAAKRPYLVLGGAYVSRVMAGLKSPRLFDVVDALILHDGERPLWELIQSRKDNKDAGGIPNLVFRDTNGVVRHNPIQPAIPLSDLPAPDFSFVPFKKYLIDSDRMELPFMLSHGCYWQKCAFCNNQLPLVTDFHLQDARRHILPKLQQVVDDTGIHHFNFVDEAMPPVTLSDLSQALLEKGLGIVWHGNVRAEASFTPSLCRLMSQAGCHEVQIGVESLHDDVLRDMKKGTTVERLREVFSNFRQAGIAVHAYMIHGWPTETRKHTADTLRTLKRLIADRLVSSVFWHQFTLNPSSPMFRDPEAYGIRQCRFDPDLDIFSEPEHWEVAAGAGGRPRTISWERMDGFTKRALARVAQDRPGRHEKARGNFLFAGALDKTVVFPRELVMTEGRYSLSDINEKGSRQEGVIEPRTRFRVMNLMTGAAEEISEDAAAIIRECRSASQEGTALRKVIDALTRDWGLRKEEVEQAVLSVLIRLAETGICLSGKNIR